MFDAILEHYKEDKKVKELFNHLEQRLTILLELNCIEWSSRLHEVSILYYYLYCLPLLEVTRKNKKLNEESELIYSHFLFCLLARFQDNILDDDFGVFGKTESMRLSCTILTEAKQSFLKAGLIWDQRISKVFNEFYEYEDELLNPNEIDNELLYKRVSFLLIVPEALVEEIGNHFIISYKYYLNYCLLRHDIQDLLNDVKKMKRSFITDKFELRHGFYQAKTVHLFKEILETLNNFITLIKASSIGNIFFEVAFINATKEFEI